METASPLRLSGKVALVTGGSRGIGAAIAVRLARDGAKVVVNYARDTAAAAKVVARIRASGGEACAVQADIARIDRASSFVAEASGHYGGLDILVNNAAIVEPAVLEDVDEALFDRHFNTNLKAAFFLSQAAARAFGDGGGAIVNVSSIGTRAATPQFMVYCATKAALEMLTVTMARHLGPRGIRVNAVAPGQIDTEMLRQAVAETVLKANVERIALGRLGRAEDIADVVAFLASDEARWITGETIHANGGQRL